MNTRAGKTGKIAGIVMAGGKSLRMGSDKAMLRLNPEKNFLRLAFDKLGRAADACYVSCAFGQAYAGYACIEDEVENSGPASGIMSSLKFASARGFSHILVLACDMPLMTCWLLRKLAAKCQSGGKLLTVYQSEQTACLEMLAAAYSVEALPCFAAALAKGEKRLAAIIPAENQMRIRYGTELAPNFMNCNTLADLRRLRELAGA